MLDHSIFPFCDDVNKYEKLMKVGQGTFGEVYKAVDRQSRKLVALKKVLMDNEREGFPITSIRELKILKALSHENIVNLIEVCSSKDARENQGKDPRENQGKAIFYLVFEFCEHDLAGLLSNAQIRFSLAEIKSIMQMLLNALYFLHYNRILHRDMKTANILMTKSGILKLTDFGLARAVYPGTENMQLRYTNRVVTLWYRPPELLLGVRSYTGAIDMWGAGCIMAEIWTRSPIMQGRSEQHQLNLISILCGSINKSVWENVEQLEFFNKVVLQKHLKRHVKEKLEPYIKDTNAIDLIDKLLTLDPSKRIDADTALNHDFFWTEPMPRELKSTMSRVTSSMFELYTARRNGRYNNGGRGQPANNSFTNGSNTAIYDRVF